MTQYVRKNAYRMDYPRYQAKGWQIGSGCGLPAPRTAKAGRSLEGSATPIAKGWSDQLPEKNRTRWRSESFHGALLREVRYLGPRTFITAFAAM
ncbi:hypothetical protein SAMN05444166_7351 [Singulisphaera sp. GP187]|nr:hypothetical protein SAMN05444166_7351 [Singulisphaera sp. GP187]